MADLKSDEAEGTARRARTIWAPELCPAMEILDALPPKEGPTVCKNLSPVTTSFTARFVWPLGAMNPN